MTDPFYKFRAEAGDEPTNAELLIFAAIGDWEDMGEVSAKAFAADLAKLPTSVRRLDIHINSPGGSVAEAQGIYSRLADHRSEKIVYIDGLAASAASLIAMVGHKVYIRANANMMIHLPSGITMGDADEMRKMAAALDSVTESMISNYAKKTKLDREELHSLLRAETWFTAQQAVEKGFADEVRGVIKTAAIARNRVIFNGLEFDLSRFRNVPAFESATTTAGDQPMPAPTKPTATNTPATEEETPTPPPKPPTPPPTPPPKPPEPAAAPPAAAPTPPAAAASDFDRGVESERARVLALQKLDRPATHAIIAKAIADGKTVADITAEAFDAMEKAGAQNARRSDASVLNGIPGSESGNGDESDTFGKLIKEKVSARMKSRPHRASAISRK